MKNGGQTDAQKLGPGQLWRLKRRYVHIVAQEGIDVRFKLLNAPNEIEGTTLTGEHDTVLRYLHSRSGHLMGS